MIAGFLNHSASLLEPQYVTDLAAGVSGGTQLWPYVAQGERVRVEDASARQIESMAQRGIEITHRIFTTSTLPKNGFAWHYDDRLYIVREILRRRAIGGMPGFNVNLCKEIAPGG